MELRKRVGRGQLFQMSVFAPRAAVTGMRFRFTRAIKYNNSFLPVVEASVLPGSRDGARVAVRVRPIWLVAAFTAFWMIGTSVGAIAFMCVAIWNGRLVGLAALMLPAFGVAASAIFAYEARKAEQLLREVFPPAPHASDGPYR